MKKGSITVLLLLLLGCAEGEKTIYYYKENTAERREKIGYCKDSERGKEGRSELHECICCAIRVKHASKAWWLNAGNGLKLYL